jgi:nucleolar protein 56
MAPHFVLFEHAAGYALFKLKEFEEVATFLPQVEESVLDVSKFSQVSLSFSRSCSKRLSIKEV